ncbi:MAG TPA: hypothetical protein VML50_12730 [Anaeromyxobacter sp.]|nr:hypothetical protein [Anaeromyxobacter sp.]
MTPRAHLAALALALAACNSTGGGKPAGMVRPTAVAPFWGYAPSSALIQPYLAVSSPGRDELVLIDAVTDQAVLAPVMLRPLAVPVPEPEPTLLASCALGDDVPTGGTPGSTNHLPDLLVAVSSGSSVVQVIRTWTPEAVVDRTLDLGVEDPSLLGSRVLAMVCATVPPPVAAGQAQARLILSLAGGRIAVVGFSRATDGSNKIAPVATGGPTVLWHDFGFDSVSLAVPYDSVNLILNGDGTASPRAGSQLPPAANSYLTVPFPVDQTSLFAASPDPIPDPAFPGAYGAARLDMSANPADPSTWTVSLLSTGTDPSRGIPTRLVAAWTLVEWSLQLDLSPTGPLPDGALFQGQALGQDVAQPGGPAGTPVERVYAVLDESYRRPGFDGGGCGPLEEVPCGVAVLDPTLAAPVAGRGHMPADPSGTGPFLRPIAIPGRPLALAIAPPQLEPLITDPTQTTNALYPFRGGLVAVAAVNGVLRSDAVMAVPAADGLTYVVDLSRWAVPSEISLVHGGARTRPFSATEVDSGTGARLGLWNRNVVDLNGNLIPFAVYNSEGDATDAVVVTPGFTNDRTWQVSYQGILPGLGVRRGVTEASTDPSGPVLLALQPPGTPTSAVRLYDPQLAIHSAQDFPAEPGDRVLLSFPTSVPAACPPASLSTALVSVPVEANVAALLPPDAAHPGGSVVLKQCGLVATGDPSDANCASAACLAALAPAPPAQVEVIATIRVSGYLLASSSAEYGGRPTPSPGGLTPAAYYLSYFDYDSTGGVVGPVDEVALEAGCGLLPWPLLAPGAYPACGTACRQQCERLILARRARRLFIPYERCKREDEDNPTGSNEDLYCRQSVPVAQDPFPLGFPTIPTSSSSVRVQGIGGAGAALAFELGLVPGGTTAVPTTVPVRDAKFEMVVTSGILPMYRRAPSGTAGSAELPGTPGVLDRSPWNPGDQTYFLVPYVDGHVLDFRAGASSAQVGVIR